MWNIKQTSTLEQALQLATSSLKMYRSRYLKSSLEKRSYMDILALSHWISSSTQLESQGMNENDTRFFLQFGLTTAGKTIEKYLQLVSQKEAIAHLTSTIDSKLPISEHLISTVHRHLSTHSPHCSLGKYKSVAHKGHNAMNGARIPFTEPDLVHIEMNKLVNWINHQQPKLNPIVTASIIHNNIVRVHPFTTDNYLLARIVCNIPMLSEGFLPLFVPYTPVFTRRYHDTVAFALEMDDCEPFTVLMAECAQANATLLMNKMEEHEETERNSMKEE